MLWLFPLSVLSHLRYETNIRWIWNSSIHFNCVDGILIGLFDFMFIFTFRCSPYRRQKCLLIVKVRYVTVRYNNKDTEYPTCLDLFIPAAKDINNSLLLTLSFTTTSIFKEKGFPSLFSFLFSLLWHEIFILFHPLDPV